MVLTTLSTKVITFAAGVVLCQVTILSFNVDAVTSESSDSRLSSWIGFLQTARVMHGSLGLMPVVKINPIESVFPHNCYHIE